MWSTTFPNLLPRRAHAHALSDSMYICTRNHDVDNPGPFLKILLDKYIMNDVISVAEFHMLG